MMPIFQVRVSRFSHLFGLTEERPTHSLTNSFTHSSLQKVLGTYYIQTAKIQEGTMLIKNHLRFEVKR